MSDESPSLNEVKRDDEDDDGPSPPGIMLRHPETTPGNSASLTPA